MDKFTSQIQVEEDPAFQAWIDAQEVADLREMEEEALRGARLIALNEILAAEGLYAGMGPE
jgi:hypothetical protein